MLGTLTRHSTTGAWMKGGNVESCFKLPDTVREGIALPMYKNLTDFYPVHFALPLKTQSPLINDSALESVEHMRLLAGNWLSVDQIKDALSATNTRVTIRGSTHLMMDQAEYQNGQDQEQRPQP
jgi:hypothetical protein